MAKKEKKLTGTGNSSTNLGFGDALSVSTDKMRCCTSAAQDISYGDVWLREQGQLLARMQISSAETASAKIVGTLSGLANDSFRFRQAVLL